MKYLDENPNHDEQTTIPRAPLAFRNETIRQLYQQEEEEVKVEIEKSREKLSDDDLDDEDDLDQGERVRRKEAVQFQT